MDSRIRTLEPPHNFGRYGLLRLTKTPLFFLRFNRTFGFGVCSCHLRKAEDASKAELGGSFAPGRTAEWIEIRSSERVRVTPDDRVDAGAGHNGGWGDEDKSSRLSLRRETASWGGECWRLIESQARTHDVFLHRVQRAVRWNLSA